MDIQSDGEREADADNPRGYYEWEAIKQIGKRPELLDEEGLDSRVIKVVSPLLTRMPRHHRYRVLFMTRPVEEVVASQEKMIERKGGQGANWSGDQLRRGLEHHREQALHWLRQAEHVEFLGVSFPGLLSDPEPVLKEIVDFVGRDRLPAADRMIRAIDPDLYRQRKEP